MVRVGLWGTFDLENYGDMLFPRVAKLELARRIPRLVVRTWSPIGYVGRNRFEDPASEPSEPLGTFGEMRLEELARELDVLIIGGGEIVHDRDWELAPHYGLAREELERRQTHRFFVEGLGKHEVDVPTAWHAVGLPHDPDETLSERLRASLAHRAYVSVRDERSLGRLRTAGVDREIAVVPDPVYLLPRLLPVDVLAARIDRLRTTGALPPGDTLLVQGSRSLVPDADAIAAGIEEICRDRSLVPVLVETGPIHGDGELADALADRLAHAVRFPPIADADDLTAAIAWSSGFLGNSLHGNIVAAAYDRPGLMLDLAGQSKLRGAGELLGAPERVVDDHAAIASAYRRVWDRDSIATEVDALRARVDAHFDRLAEVASATGSSAEAPPPPHAPRLQDERERYARAARSLGPRMAAQQAAFADRQLELETLIARQADDALRSDAALNTAGEQIARFREEVSWLRGIIAERDAELARLRPLLKYSPPWVARRMVGRVRRLLRRER
jgi:polysaccharide pyruvyl transferase WcaK-like protein